MFKAEMLYRRRISRTNQEINKTRKEIENTTDRLLKNTYIFILNELIAKKNRSTMNLYKENNLSGYFNTVCGGTLKENKTIQNENETIVKNDLKKTLIPLKEYQI